MDTIMQTRNQLSIRNRLKGMAFLLMLVGCAVPIYQVVVQNLSESTPITYASLALFGLGFAWQIVVFIMSTLQPPPAKVDQDSIKSNAALYLLDPCPTIADEEEKSWSEEVINPATGYKMYGSIDAAGNVYGTTNI